MENRLHQIHFLPQYFYWKYNQRIQVDLWDSFWRLCWYFPLVILAFYLPSRLPTILSSCSCSFLFHPITTSVGTLNWDRPSMYLTSVLNGYQWLIFFFYFFPKQMQLGNTFSFSAMPSNLFFFFFFPSESFCCSLIYHLCWSLIYFLLLLCLKIYEVFIHYPISVPDICILLSAHLCLTLTKFSSYQHKNCYLWKYLGLILFFFITRQTKNNIRITGVSDTSEGEELAKAFLWALNQKTPHMLAKQHQDMVSHQSQ